LLTEVGLETIEEQPQSWKGGVGDPEEEVRRNGVGAVVSYIWWWQDQNNCLGDDGLDEPLRGAIQTRIIEDSAVPVRTALGRHFQTFWAADKNLIQTHLDDLFPKGDEKRGESAVFGSVERVH